MSDLSFALVSLSHAHAAPARFRTRTFASAGRALGSGQHEPGDTPETCEQAYARGFGAGIAQVTSEFGAEQVRMRALVANTNALQPEPSDELSVLIVEAVAKLALLAVGEAPIDREWLVARAQEAAAIIADCDAARTVWVHPDDAAFLTEAGLALAIHPDPDAEPGSIRIACSSGWIEHGRPLYLEQIDALRIAG